MISITAVIKNDVDNAKFYAKYLSNFTVIGKKMSVSAIKITIFVISDCKVKITLHLASVGRKLYEHASLD